MRTSGWCSAPDGAAPMCAGCRVLDCEHSCHSPNAQSPTVERDPVSYVPVIRGSEGVESGADKRSPSRVLGGPQPGLLDSNILDERKC